MSFLRLPPATASGSNLPPTQLRVVVRGCVGGMKLANPNVVTETNDPAPVVTASAK